jgi:hypothetical protein
MIIHLRQNYHFGSMKIAMRLQPYQGITMSTFPVPLAPARPGHRPRLHPIRDPTSQGLQDGIVNDDSEAPPV